MMIFGQQIDVKAIDAKTEMATCIFSMAEATKMRGEKCSLGGYNGRQERIVPVTDIITGEEKAELRNLKRSAMKGHTDRLMAYYDGATNLAEALAVFYKRIAGTSRLRRVMGQDSTGCLCMEIVKKK